MALLRLSSFVLLSLLLGIPARRDFFRFWFFLNNIVLNVIDRNACNRWQEEEKEMNE
jgi:hypothetical protein